MCFAFVYPYSVDVVEATPPGAAEDHWSCWDVQRRGHHFCCTCACSSGEYNSCATFFLQCSSLERASRSLAKTGFFFTLFQVLFSCPFPVRLFGGLGGYPGGRWVDFGAIWGAFWGHFGHFFRVRWIFENNGFTIVKQYFLRSGRVLDRDFFLLCFWIYTFTVFCPKFEDLLAPRVSISFQMNLFWGPRGAKLVHN